MATAVGAAFRRSAVVSHARILTASLWLLSAMGFTACGDWPWQHDMVNQPSRAVGENTRSAVRGTVASGADLSMTRELAEQRLRNPIRADAPVDRGRALFETYCVPCHGQAMNGGGTVSRYFGPMQDLTSADVQQHGDGWFYATIANGTDRMPHYAFELTPDERWQIVHFLRAAGAAR